jgi:N-acetylmuramoyl-L-alanine amidase
MPRPAMMPSVLVESLFMSNRTELQVLVRPAVLTAIAGAYYDGIARWLNHRDYGLRYDLSSVPTSAPAGGSAAVDMHLTNRGNRSSQGWVLQARIVPAVPYYDGSPVRGTLVATTALPDGLKPGASLNVSMPDIPMPATNGEWLLKFDVRLPGGGFLGDHGVVGPQIRITTDGAAASQNDAVFATGGF